MLNEGRYRYDGLRRTFGDGKTQRIETLINSIREAFATWTVAIKAKRSEDELRKREWEEAKRRWEEQQRYNALERKRVEALSKDLDRWHQGGQILDYVAAVREKLNTADYQDTEAVEKWIEWAEDYAARLDPLANGLPRLLEFDNFNSWEFG